MHGPDPELLALLARGEGAALLADLPPYDEETSLALGTRLRQDGHDPALVAAALTQSRLRAGARQRLGELAHRLLLTQDGLEQATRPPVSRRRAQRFLDAGVRHVWDLGCGLGLDAIALAEAGLEVSAVERDAVVAAAARANLEGYPGVQVIEGDAAVHRPGGSEGAFLDPARRLPGTSDARGRTRRTFRLDDLSPSWEVVQAVAAGAAATGAKLSPGFPHAHLPPGVEAEWVSLDGSVLECALWWEGAARRPGRHAVVGRVGADGAVSWTRISAPEGVPDRLTSADALGPYLVEPDRAVLAAGRVDALAALVDGRELDTGVGYVSAGQVRPVPWARWYAVREVLPLHAKPVRAWLRAQGVERVTVKKRGVPTDPERFHAELRLPRPRGRGPAPEATLVLTRVAGDAVVVAVDPLPAPAA